MFFLCVWVSDLYLYLCLTKIYPHIMEIWNELDRFIGSLVSIRFIGLLD